MQSKSISVRPARQSDKEGWQKLYYGYAKFYKVDMNQQILDTLWGWIHDPEHETQCLLAFIEDEDAPSGLAHISRMCSPLRGTNIGYLNDLFVDPERRGNRIGETLFEALEDHAKSNGWPFIRWVTADDNYRARGLYDKLSTKTMWNTYQMDID